MRQPIYEALCLGGPMAGQFLSHTQPVYEMVVRTGGLMLPKAATMKTKNVNYYYVPLVGLRGFWLYEDETKGTQPYDDIIRLLCDSYVKHQEIVRKAAGMS